MRSIAIHRLGSCRGASRSRRRVPPSAVSISRRARSAARRRGTRSGATRARIEIATGSWATAATMPLHQTVPSLPGARSTVAHGRTWGCSIGPMSVSPARSSDSMIQSWVSASHSGSVQIRSSPTSTPCSVARVPEPALVTVTRNGLAESTHRVHVAVTRADGSLVAGCGDVDRPTTMRSCAKPHQVEPLIASGGFDALGLDDRVLAVTCASHMGQDIHVEAVARGLGRLRPHRRCARQLHRDGRGEAAPQLLGQPPRLPRPLGPQRLGDGGLPASRASVAGRRAGRGRRPRRRAGRSRSRPAPTAAASSPSSSR